MNIQALILAGAIVLSLSISSPMMGLAQEEEQQTAEQIPEDIEIPLNFTLKAQDGDDGELNATEAKDVTVTLSVQSGEDGSPMQIPVTAKVANDTQAQDLELCHTLQGEEETCNSLEQIVEEKNGMMMDNKTGMMEKNGMMMDNKTGMMEKNGMMMNPEKGMMMDNKTGMAMMMNPEKDMMMMIDNKSGMMVTMNTETGMVENKTGMMIGMDPNSGMPMIGNKETGEMMDPEEGKNEE